MNGKLQNSRLIHAMARAAFFVCLPLFALLSGPAVFSARGAETPADAGGGLYKTKDGQIYRFDPKHPEYWRPITKLDLPPPDQGSTLGDWDSMTRGLEPDSMHDGGEAHGITPPLREQGTDTRHLGGNPGYRGYGDDSGTYRGGGGGTSNYRGGGGGTPNYRGGGGGGGIPDYPAPGEPGRR